MEPNSLWQYVKTNNTIRNGRRDISGIQVKLRTAIAILLLCCSTIPSAAIKKEEGSYRIGTAQELKEFIRLVEEDSAACATLTADIDFSVYDDMIGSKRRYTGTFDGCCHKITVNYDSPGEYKGLFKFIGEGCEVKNLQVAGHILSHNQYAAGLVADIYSGTVSNCLVTVDIESDYTGDCTYGGISGFTTGETRIRNCVYAGSIKAPLGKRVGGLVGWVDNPGTFIENSIAICHAELGTDENSNSVVRCHDRSYVKLHNVFYVNDIKSGFDGAQKVSFEELQNGRIFYQVLGSEIYSAEQQLDQYEQDLYVAKVKLRLIAVIALLLTLLLINLFLIYRYRRRQTRLLFQKLLVEHALWEGRQQRILDFNPQPAEKFIDIVGTDRTDEGSREIIVLAKESQAENVADDTLMDEAESDTEDTAQDGTLPKEVEASEPEGKETNHEELRRIYQLVQKDMAEHQYYTDMELDIRKLALHIGTNRSTLSRAINRFSDGKNFSVWLAEYRLNYAIELMDNMERPLSPEEIAARSGFSSRSTFYRQFKTFTGLTPKQYLRNRRG